MELVAVVGVTAGTRPRLVSGVMVLEADETAGLSMVTMPPLLVRWPKVPDVLTILFPLLTDLSPTRPLKTFLLVPTLPIVSPNLPILVLLQVVVVLEPAAIELTATILPLVTAVSLPSAVHTPLFE